MTRSRYEELHDKYHSIATSKCGTRYERLAAFVFKSLDERSGVIHDLRLIGDTGVEHQIDVTIEVDGTSRRILLECKDYDISGDKVGLEIVRCFWAVMDDTKPDEGIIVTCNDFSRDARIYAKGKGIKLAVLRDFRETDWEGRVRAIEVTMGLYDATTPSVALGFGKESHFQQLNADLAAVGIESLGTAPALPVSLQQPLFVNLPTGKVQIKEFIDRKVLEYPKQSPGPVRLRLEFKGATIQVADRDPIPIDGMMLKFDITCSELHFTSTSKRIAELILQGFGDSDTIVFDEDLKRFKTDETTGEVISA